MWSGNCSNAKHFRIKLLADVPLLQTLFVICTSQLAPLLPVIGPFLSWFHNANTSEVGPCTALERVLELPSHRTARNLHCSWGAIGVRNGACRGCGRAETQHSEPMAAHGCLLTPGAVAEHWSSSHMGWISPALAVPEQEAYWGAESSAL